MKKIKLLTPILLTTLVTGGTLPLVASCGCSTEDKIYLELADAKQKNYLHATDADPYPSYSFNLKQAYEANQTFKCEYSVKKGDMILRTADIDYSRVTNGLLKIYVGMDGAQWEGDLCVFDIKIRCINQNGSTAWEQTVNDLRLVNGKSYSILLNDLYEKTISEFIELSKIPHPSNPKGKTHTSENDAMNPIRNYIKKKVNSLGYALNRDSYGSVWFDVPATDGYEKYPTVILQGHMDMVCSGWKPGEELIYGPKVIRDWESDTESKPGETIWHEILHADRASSLGVTSIGADDGISIALILSLLQIPEFAHGQLRVIFTSDEETGMYGAKNLPSSVLNADYLINIDGEGTKQDPYVINNGCYGFCEYTYAKDFAMGDKEAGLTTYKLTLSGFDGKHYITHNHYNDKHDGKVHQYANCDDMVFQMLNEILKTKRVQISSISHSYDPETQLKEARYMPTDVEIIFATDETEANITQMINSTVDGLKTFEHKAEDGTKVYFDKDEGTIAGAVTTVSDTGLQFMGETDTGKLVGLFGQQIKYICQTWDGETTAEKEANDYPIAGNNYSWTEIKDGHFTAASRGNAFRKDDLEEFVEMNTQPWKDTFGSAEGITEISTHGSWDPGTNTDLITLTEHAYMAQGITPKKQKVRGGVEPAYFSMYKPNLKQTCIGPWLEDIHEKGERLYLETLKPLCNTVVYLLQNIW